MKALALRFAKNPRIRNSIWMVIEKGIAFFGLIFVVSAVAKYLGPDVYGYIALATSIFSIVSVVGRFGLDQIYFKSVSKNKTKTDILLKNMVLAIQVTYTPIALVILFIFYFKVDFQYFIFFIATAIASYLMTIDLRAFHLDALLMSKVNVFANIFGLIVSLSIRYLIVTFKLNIQFFAIPIILFALIPFLMRIYIIKHRKIFFEYYKFNSRYFKRYFVHFVKIGAPLAISMLSVSIYIQSSSFILAYWGGSQQVGLYSVASMLASAWCFLPTTIAMSYLSLIYEKKTNNEYLEISAMLLRYLIIISIFIVLFLFLMADNLIIWLYGDQYYNSILTFKILLFSYFFSTLGFYFYRLIIKFDGYSFLAKKMFLTCLINLFLAFFLIKEFGLAGAAISALITEFVSNIILNLFFRKLQLLTLFSKAMGLNCIGRF